MKIIRVVLIISAVLLQYPASALTGGLAVNGSDHPYSVKLSFDGIYKGCDGVVLGPRKVLTSITCAYHVGTLIPANKIYVHPATNGEIGPFILSPLNPQDTPSIQVSSYALHPQNDFFLGPYNIAILTLSANLNVTPAYLYNGMNKFIGQNGTALGWEEVDLPGPLIQRKYVLKKLSFPLVQSTTNFNSLCYDDISPTGTVFCGGFRNAVQYLETEDQGGAMLRRVNGRDVVIGILKDASNGSMFGGLFHYEEFARVSAMISFIMQHAPSAQFWNETSIPPEPDKVIITPVLQLLLLE